MDTIGNAVEEDEIVRYWKDVISKTISLDEFRETLVKNKYNIVKSLDDLFREDEIYSFN